MKNLAMVRIINPNLRILQQSFFNQKYQNDQIVSGKRGVVLEGSSRSGKTWSGIDFIILACSRYLDNAVVNIVKETYNEFKTTLYNDWRKRLNDFNLDNPFEYKQEVQSFKIGTNQINFLGADKPSKFHGAQSDILWLNEALPIDKSIFDQAEMRCTKFWFMDYNPSVTEHWIFNSVINRPDVGFLRTSWKDNPYVSTQEKNKILSYEPTADNIKNGTADDYMWKVYGLGLRGDPQGLIFKHVNWIDEWPKDMPHSYGMDFGYVADPTVIVKYFENQTDIYIDYLCYEPIDNPHAINDFAEKSGINKRLPVTADSADKYTAENKGTVQMVKDLKDLGWNIKKVNKNKSVIYWLGSMRRKRINVVRNVNAKREFENYKYREINGIVINEPIDKYNHGIDAARYRHMELNSLTSLPII